MTGYYNFFWLFLWGLLITIGFSVILGTIRAKIESRRKWKDFHDLTKRFWD